MIVIVCLVPFFLPGVAVLLAALSAALERLPALWCAVAHRKHHFHGMSVTRCLRCGRTWISRLFVVPGGGERSGLRRAEPELRSVGGRRA